MYLLYVDESGDSGALNSPTRYFILSAIVLHELKWRPTLENLTAFRKLLKDHKGLKLNDEIHCTKFISSPGVLVRIKRNDRLDILKKCIDWLGNQPDIAILSVVVDKENHAGKDIFEYAWHELLIQFEHTIRLKSLPGAASGEDMGIILSDNTYGEKLRELIRKMRHRNMSMRLQFVIEDPIFRDSRYSFLHQMTDVIAYFAKQLYEPNKYIKTKGAHNFYKRLSNVSCSVVSDTNSMGIVELG